MYEVLNHTLSQAQDFAEVPPVRTADAICYPKPGDYVQYKICPETECEELVYMFDQSKSMIEVLELQDQPAHCLLGKDMGEQTRAMAIRQLEESSQCTCEKIQGEERDHHGRPHDQSRGETLPAWRDIGDANMDETFLFPETDDSKCPVNKHARKLSKDEANEYMKWIQLQVPIHRQEGRKGILPILRHEEPPALDMPPLLQAPEAEREALMHIVHRRTSSFSLSSSFGQWRNCDAQLGTARTQNGER